MLTHNPRSSNFMQKLEFVMCYMYQYAFFVCISKKSKTCVLQKSEKDKRLIFAIHAKFVNLTFLDVSWLK